MLYFSLTSQLVIYDKPIFSPMGSPLPPDPPPRKYATFTTNSILKTVIKKAKMDSSFRAVV